MAGKLVTFISLIFVTTAASMAVPAKRQNFGQGTWFNSNAFGACGNLEFDSQHIVAVSTQLVNQLGKPGVCGRTIVASSGGRSTTVTVTDSCPGCGINDLDFSPTAFQDLADLSVGRINIEWSFV
ncbi:hypothetical protein BD410DRAFT_840733 [Rickenella mellea]|uniref:RlpA-like protein double-psi beta-barrel domain-containing protein n=1 Tax=Rickenella mellea TaxID=50990 RepID=A0A4Y7Q1T4_9AGAM|nr:hypothetical protein BD410DRAFT_840733 [Rickenella mellea]